VTSIFLETRYYSIKKKIEKEDFEYQKMIIFTSTIRPPGCEHHIGEQNLGDRLFFKKKKKFKKKSVNSGRQ